MIAFTRGIMNSELYTSQIQYVRVRGKVLLFLDNGLLSHNQ
jgi:hypothetical protein